jgi:nitrate reductase alpha subunit
MKSSPPQLIAASGKARLWIAMSVAARMGWLPFAPQTPENLTFLGERGWKAKAVDPIEHVVDRMSKGDLRMSVEDPDDPKNWPRNMFVWRSNILGSSGKGHEYFMKYIS